MDPDFFESGLQPAAHPGATVISAVQVSGCIPVVRLVQPVVSRTIWPLGCQNWSTPWLPPPRAYKRTVHTSSHPNTQLGQGSGHTKQGHKLCCGAHLPQLWQKMLNSSTASALESHAVSWKSTEEFSTPTLKHLLFNYLDIFTAGLLPCL